MNEDRQPKGQPTGGEFAARQRDDATVTLDTPQPNRAIRSLLNLIGHEEVWYGAAGEPPMAKADDVRVNPRAVETALAQGFVRLVGEPDYADLRRVEFTGLGYAHYQGFPVPEPPDARTVALGVIASTFMALLPPVEPGGRPRVDWDPAPWAGRKPTAQQIAWLLDQGLVHVQGDDAFGELDLTEQGQRELAVYAEHRDELNAMSQVVQQHRTRVFARRVGSSTVGRGAGRYLHEAICEGADCGWRKTSRSGPAYAEDLARGHQRDEADKILARGSE